ncbi:MAG: 16S rRNA (guanine(966)-N(2))-methyltransferase RsmD [Acidobacteria bacterium]|nr:16S rRNA (guanine(966)-N(2))-methyltransferase RsmD [Acidobacteriota bacterium]
MRVIAGKYRGRRLAPTAASVRPTSERLRESLFAVIGQDVNGSKWIDLFAGSGAVGIEALSRGAAFCLFNERDPAALFTLKKNLKLCGIESGFEISSEDAFVFIRKAMVPRADFVFLDPPYDFQRYEKLLRKVSSAAFVNRSTVIILEMFKKKSLELISPEVELLRQLRQGDSLLLFLRPQRQS